MSDVSACATPLLSMHACRERDNLPTFPFLSDGQNDTRTNGAANPRRRGYPRYITFSFDLSRHPDASDDVEVLRTLHNVFPTTHHVSLYDGVLEYLVENIPERPWPKRVACVPINVHTLPRVSHPLGPFFGLMRFAKPCLRGAKIAEHIDGRNMNDWDPLFDAVSLYFHDQNIGITTVIYMMDGLLVVLKERATTDLAKLVGKAGGITCFYLYEDQMGRPVHPQSRHRIDEPDMERGHRDYSNYGILQPGVVVSSTPIPGKRGEFMSTTTGVLVQQDATGDRFMTVACHRFPDQCGKDVIHPTPTDNETRTIGRVVGQVGVTDVGLVQLQPDEIFVNLTFKNEDHPNGMVLRRLVGEAGFQSYENVYMDTPETGALPGTVSWQGRDLVQDSDSQYWIRTNWLYTGEDVSSRLPASICGAAIYNDDGNVYGFFQYAPKEGAMAGYCCGTSAEELIQNGFTLVA